jgi:hypothetical protein
MLDKILYEVDNSASFLFLSKLFVNHPMLYSLDLLISSLNDTKLIFSYKSFLKRMKVPTTQGAV